MSYTKMNPQPDGLHEGETAVELDTSHKIGVTVSGEIQPVTGKHVVVVTARVLDRTSQAIPVTYRYTVAPEQLANLDAIRRECVRQVLGEPPSAEWADPIHAERLADVNIRHRIAAAERTGDVDASALL